MKKLISIGVALALLTMAVVPGAVAAQPAANCTGNWTYPDTFAKIPFAIVQSGIELVGDLLGPISSVITLPAFLTEGLMDTIAAWSGGPLSWTVDMLGWGLSLVGTVVGILDTELVLGFPWAETLIQSIVCSIFTPFDCVVGPDFDPCP